MKKKPRKKESQSEIYGESPVERALIERREETAFYRRSLKREGVVLLLFLVGMLLLNRVLFGLARVDGSSMYPEYHDRDLVLYLRMSGEPKRNDVVLVDMEDGRTLIKRVIGLPGEEVYIDDSTRTVFIDGRELEEEYGPTDPERVLSYPVKLGEGEYFVLGDNRNASMDSRYCGAVTRGQIRGKALITLRVTAKNIVSAVELFTRSASPASKESRVPSL